MLIAGKNSRPTENGLPTCRSSDPFWTSIQLRRRGLFWVLSSAKSQEYHLEVWHIIHLQDGLSNSPWNCPHPRYRLHAKSIKTIHRKKGKTKTDHVWQWGQFCKGSKGLARGDSSTESRDGSCIPSPEEHEVDLQLILCLTPWRSVGTLYSHST